MNKYVQIRQDILKRFKLHLILISCHIKSWWKYFGNKSTRRIHTANLMIVENRIKQRSSIILRNKNKLLNNRNIALKQVGKFQNRLKQKFSLQKHFIKQKKYIKIIIKSNLFITNYTKKGQGEKILSTRIGPVKTTTN